MSGSLQFSVFWIVLCVGTLIGRALTKVSGRRKAKALPATPLATCPCGHTIGEHKDERSCQAQTRRPYYYSNGSRNGHQWVKCVCTKYYGPQPLTDLFHPGTLFPTHPVDKPTND